MASKKPKKETPADGEPNTGVKPKRLAKLTPKCKERLTDVEAKYIGARLEGATMKDATETAGLAPFPQTGYKIEQRIAEKCPAVFNRVGVTIERIAKKVSDKLDAKVNKHFANKGIVLETKVEEDHATQLHAAELGLKALGALNREVSVEVEHTHTVNLREVPREALIAVVRLAAIGGGTVRPRTIDVAASSPAP